MVAVLATAMLCASMLGSTVLTVALLPTAAATAVAMLAAVLRRLTRALTLALRMLAAVAAAMMCRKPVAIARGARIFRHADEGMVLDHRHLHAGDAFDVAQQATLLVVAEAERDAGCAGARSAA